MIARWLYQFTARLPARLIKIEGQPYLERYYLGEAFGRYWYLHRFVRDDQERAVHDHPWRSAWAFVLTGRYREERTALRSAIEWPVIRIRTVRFFNRIRRRAGHRDLHRIVSIKPETWTLFGHTAWEHGWGHYRISDSTVTYREFKPAPTPNQGPDFWWIQAPAGADIGREPFRR